MKISAELLVMRTITTVVIFLCVTLSYGQNIQDIIDQVDLGNLTVTLNEFSGEQTTTVNGNTVSIIDRRQAVNDIAADYLIERFQELDNITITDQSFNTNGRNIIATQLGKTNPENIYMICAHYDTVTNFCADDNASGTGAILEIARILSTQCLDNTIVYALWDEEEIGLLGSAIYATQAQTDNDNILGVYNIDMIAYDGDGDNSFDIDVKQGDAGSIAMGNAIINVLNSYTFNLNHNLINPGTEQSDHSSFWNRGFPAALVGEAWSENDQNDQYHTSGDVVSNLNLSFYHEMVKLSAAYMATVGGLVAVDNTITLSTTALTSNQSTGTYQWVNCDTNTPIAGATNQTFIPSVNGNYAVEVTSGTCFEISNCIAFNSLSVATFLESEITIFPNPVSDELKIESHTDSQDLELKLYTVSGKLVLDTSSSENLTSIHMKPFPQGTYFLSVRSDKKSGTYKIVK